LSRARTKIGVHERWSTTRPVRSLSSALSSSVDGRASGPSLIRMRICIARAAPASVHWRILIVRWGLTTPEALVVERTLIESATMRLGAVIAASARCSSEDAPPVFEPVGAIASTSVTAPATATDSSTHRSLLDLRRRPCGVAARSRCG
jgi:hypothetical protein